jgi:hypothetical protein
METCIYGRHMQECQLYCTTYNRNIQKKEKKKKENRRIQQHDNNSLQQNPQKTKSSKTKQKISMTFVRGKEQHPDLNLERQMSNNGTSASGKKKQKNLETPMAFA